MRKVGGMEGRMEGGRGGREGWREGGMAGGRELYIFSYTHKERDIRWTNHVTNVEGIQQIKMDRNILHTLKRKGANWTGHILGRN